MTTIDVTCSCGKLMKAPARYAGKRGRCKACGATIEIPDEQSLDTFAVADSPHGDAWAGLSDPSADADALAVVASSIETDEDEAEDVPASFRRPFAVAPSRPHDDEPSDPEPQPIPFEPWYYEFLVLYAQ